MALAITEIDTTEYRQGPADWCTITATMVPNTTAPTKIEDDKLPTTGLVADVETFVTGDFKTGSTRTIREFYNALKTEPNHQIQMEDIYGEVFTLSAIGRTRPQPILFPEMTRNLPTGFALTAAAPVAIVLAAADEEFTLEEATEKDLIRNRQFWHLTIGQPLLTVEVVIDKEETITDDEAEIDFKEIITTNRLANRQGVTDDQPIILITDEPRLIRVGDVLMYTSTKPAVEATPL